MSQLPAGRAVRHFHELMGAPAPADPQALSVESMGFRRKLIMEEWTELNEAYDEGDLAGFLKEAVDLVYVVVGTCVEAGLPFDEAFDAVHRSNMEKALLCEACGGSGSVVWVSDPQGDEWGECEPCAGLGRIVVRRDDGKVLKPVGWQAPDIASLIGKEEDAADTPRPA